MCTVIKIDTVSDPWLCAGTFTTAPYDYDLIDASDVINAVSDAGATLSL